MRVIVIGSGLIGLTSAWYLRKEGHEVEVIDRATGPGLETSFANGALLTPSMSEPWNSPGCWRVLLASLGRGDAALQIKLRMLPRIAGWGTRFLWNARRSAYERNTLSNLRLALYSLEATRALHAQTGIDYGRRTAGSLRVFRDEASLGKAGAAAEALASEGFACRRLTPAEVVRFEPGLAPVGDQLAGAIHYPVDEIGDAYRFCAGLAQMAAGLGVQFTFGASVDSLEVHNGKVAAALRGRERFTADQFVVAAGSHSPRLLRTAGIGLPVQPAKGYSVTLDDRCHVPLLRVPIVDDALHAVVVPLQGVIRVAGTAEFSGYDRNLDPARVDNLLRLLKSVLPLAPLDAARARPWCGLRAMSTDGVPIIGSTQIANLHVNSGHGHLGWTMAAGSGRLLADLIAGRASAIDSRPYGPARFGV